MCIHDILKTLIRNNFKDVIGSVVFTYIVIPWDLFIDWLFQSYKLLKRIKRLMTCLLSGVQQGGWISHLILVTLIAPLIRGWSRYKHRWPLWCNWKFNGAGIKSFFPNNDLICFIYHNFKAKAFNIITDQYINIIKCILNVLFVILTIYIQIYCLETDAYKVGHAYRMMKFISSYNWDYKCAFCSNF